MELERQSFESSENGLTGDETVLLLEDDTLVRGVVKAILERLGYRVLAASTPGEARALFSEHAESIRLVLSDAHFPEESSLVLGEAFRERIPGLPIVYLSAAPLDGGRFPFTEGETSFLRKPFTARDLTETVRGALDRSLPGPGPTAGTQQASAG